MITTTTIIISFAALKVKVSIISRPHIKDDGSMN